MFATLKSSDWFHTDGFPLAVERREPQEPFGPHNHEFSEIVLVTGGSGQHVTVNESFPLIRGDIFVIGGKRGHEYQNLNGLRLINVLFQPERILMQLADLPTLPGYQALFRMESSRDASQRFRSRLHLMPHELTGVTGIIDQLDFELAKRGPGFGFMATSLFMQIVGYLCRCYSHHHSSDSRAILRIAEAITHLERRSDEEIRLDELAEIAGMPKRTFIRAFQAATGSTPIAYLIQLRVGRAATLLRGGDESITDIAFRVGFSDSNYFTRQFRRLLGVTPRAYRQQSPPPAISMS